MARLEESHRFFIVVVVVCGCLSALIRWSCSSRPVTGREPHLTLADDSLSAADRLRLGSDGPGLASREDGAAPRSGKDGARASSSRSGRIGMEDLTVSGQGRSGGRGGGDRRSFSLFDTEPTALADSLFQRRSSATRIMHHQIVAAILSPTVRFRSLGRIEGAFLYDQEKGWLSFNGSQFVAVTPADVPKPIQRRCPVLIDPLTRKPFKRGSDE